MQNLLCRIFRETTLLCFEHLYTHFTLEVMSVVLNWSRLQIGNVMVFIVLSSLVSGPFGCLFGFVQVAGFVMLHHKKKFEGTLTVSLVSVIVVHLLEMGVPQFQFKVLYVKNMALYLK